MAKQPTKAQLEEKIHEQKIELERFERVDKNVREELSEFLGSTYKERYGGEEKVKILTWPGIFFELGKLKQQNTNGLNILGIHEDNREIFNKLRTIERKVFTEDELFKISNNH